MSLEISNCQRIKAFGDLRRAAFLNPLDAQIWQSIACVKNRFASGVHNTQTTIFYHSLAERVQKSDGEILGDLCRYSPELAKYLGESQLEALMEETGCHEKFLRNIAL